MRLNKRGIFSVCALLFFITGFAQTDSSYQKKENAKEKLKSIREDIIAGKIDFRNAAIKYSMDPATASQGGLYKDIPLGTFVPEFEVIAFNIGIQKVSEIFETDYGCHILLVEARRGNIIDVRHILIIPK